MISNEKKPITKKEIELLSENLSMPHCKEEREVLITYNESEDKWEAYCTSSKFARKFLKKGWTVKGIERFPNGDLCSISFSAPLYGLRIMNPENVKRNLSEEEKNILRERLASIRQQKNLV